MVIVICSESGSKYFYDRGMSEFFASNREFAIREIQWEVTRCFLRKEFLKY
ncbi:hypothetical protein MTBBW1_1170007 [Desulfamplus magnetovallimortis]|uniref:Uncharacterized protein n=1 Tax=Desulfamplus magnetovallimortis TaxID=1246637 RepID=A0A1W1H5Y3_9BACT|nr:hypothetical protein MTBBW1_1170007 [Desulfamplus magnetovallimortis]